MAPSVLVINPYAADFKLYDEWMHPLGLYFLISCLKSSGVEVRFFNCLQRSDRTRDKKYGTGDFHYQEIEKPGLYRAIPRRYKLYGRPAGDFRAFLEQAGRPAIICLGSMMTYWLPGIVETVRIIREVYPHAPLIIGGIAARLIPEVLRRLIPGVFIAESLDAAQQFLSGHGISPGTTSLPMTLLGGLQELPELRHGPILTSFGCPFSCSYCASFSLQGAFRRRPHNLVIDEIDYCIDRFGIFDFAIYDDAFLFNPGTGFIPLAVELALRGTKIRLHAPNGLHLRYIDETVATRLKAMGFVTLRFGYESGDPHHGSDTGGKLTRPEMKSKIACLAGAGFDKNAIGVYVMAGLEGQKPSDVIEEIEFIASLGVQAKPVYLSPVPGTPLFERYADNYPQLRTDPLWHNDVFFITQLPGWSFEAVEEIRTRAGDLAMKNRS